MKKIGSVAVAKVKNPVVFLRQVRIELAKVDWPSREQTIKLTIIVLGASVLMGIYLGGLDAIFTWILTFLVQ